MAVASMRELLEAGVHFGHQTRRWNPKMRRFIFTERSGIYIIDLTQTSERLDEAAQFVRNLAERNGTVLFVGTKKQAQDAVESEAKRVNMPYVNHHWLGGLLTNWRTMSDRIERLHEMRRLRDEGQMDLLPAKERISMAGELEKLEANLGGVADMRKQPDAVFIIDLKKEQLAVREARRLNLPVIALVDTNCDPDEADFVVPGNDDAIRACALITRVIANAKVSDVGDAPFKVWSLELLSPQQVADVLDIARPGAPALPGLVLDLLRLPLLLSMHVLSDANAAATGDLLRQFHEHLARDLPEGFTAALARAVASSAVSGDRAYGLARALHDRPPFV